MTRAQGNPEDWPVEPAEDAENPEQGREPESENAEARDPGDRERLRPGD